MINQCLHINVKSLYGETTKEIKLIRVINNATWLTSQTAQEEIVCKAQAHVCLAMNPFCPTNNIMSSNIQPW